MFTLDPDFTHLDVPREQLLTLLASINAVAANVPGIPTSPAMAYVAVWQTEPNLGQMVIYLYYRAHDRAVGYRPDPAKFPLLQLSELMDDAREFLESMGFMLDDLAFRAMPAALQEATLTRLPLFYRDLKVFAQAREASEVVEGEVVALVDEEATPTPTAVLPGARAAVAPESRSTQPVAPVQGRAERLGRLLASF